MARIIHYKKVASDKRKTPKRITLIGVLNWATFVLFKKRKLVVNHLNWFTFFGLPLVYRDFHTTISSTI